MEHAVGGSIFVGFHRPGLKPEGRGIHVEHPLHRTENKNACCERIADIHRDPCEGRIFGLRVPSAHTDVAPAGRHCKNGEDGENDAEKQEEPGKARGQKSVGSAQERNNAFRRGQNRSNRRGKERER